MLCLYNSSVTSMNVLILLCRFYNCSAQTNGSITFVLAIKLENAAHALNCVTYDLGLNFYVTQLYSH